MNRILKALSFTVFVSIITTSFTVVPDGLNYQAYLTNADGSAVDADISITFAAYNVDVGGVPLWSETQTITVEQGLFSITLGNPVNPFPAGLFDDPVFIGMFVAGEEMLPRRAILASAYSHKAGDANTLGGVSAAALDQSGDVGILQTDVATNDARISSIEAIGADVTEVNVSGGLTGGGTMGDISISVAPAGINASHLAPNSVNASHIVDGSIGPVDIAVAGVIAGNIAANSIFSAHISDGQVSVNKLADSAVTPDKVNSSAAFTFGGASINGPTNINGPLEIHSLADIEIFDDWNAVRWFSPDGAQQYGSIEMRSAWVSLEDETRNRKLVYSNVSGIGIGTNAPNSGYDVTIPSLIVTGQTNVGLERVLNTYAVNILGGCHSHGGLECYYGSTVVQCPVGKRVLGGGAEGPSALFGSLSSSYPSSTTSFTCASSYDLANSSRNCVAICARLQ